MPFRIALTGRMQGPEVGDVLSLIATEGTPESAVSLDDRVAALKAESAAWAK
jgi:glutamyl-tRNA synthetase